MGLKRETWILFAAALLLRMAAVFALDSPGLIQQKASPWNWGYEQAAIAESLARGDGFADAFAQGTGATAWVAPAYPALLALLIRLFGSMSAALAVALAAVHSLLSAATCLFLWRLGRGLGSPRLGRLSGWLYALHPGAIYYAVYLVWDTTLVAFGITWYLSALVASGPGASPARVRLLGLGYGALLLVNPAPAAFLPVVLYYLCRRRGGWRAASTAGAGFAACALLVCGPWMVRNQLVIGSPGLRSNLGVEVMVGNNDLALGSFHPWSHPSQDPGELALYRELGEAGYSREAMGKGIRWIRENPAAFAELALYRLRIFWIGRDPLVGGSWDWPPPGKRDARTWSKWVLHMLSGAIALVGLLALRFREMDAVLIRGALLLFPLAYLVTHVTERYRVPVDPLLTLLCAGVALWALDRARAWVVSPGDSRAPA